MKKAIFLVAGSTISIRHRCVAHFNCNKKINRLGFKISSYTGLIIMSVLFLTIAGCRVGKDYQQPALKLPKGFSNITPSDTSIGEMEWKLFLLILHFSVLYNMH